MIDKISRTSGRFMAFFLDMAIALNLYSVGHSLGLFHAPLERLSTFFIGVYVPFGDFFPFLIMILGTTWLFRLITTLYFGVSLSQMFMGIKSNGSFHGNRFKGALRTLAEIPSIILFPLLDLPLVLNKRTFKEFISGSKLEQKKGVLVRSMAFLPSFIILVSLASFWEIPFSPSIETKFGLISPEPNLDSKLKTKRYVSNNWSFETRSFLNENKYLLIPSYQIKKKGNKNRFIPELVIYDKKGKQVASMRPQRKVPLMQMMSEVKKYNPLFTIFYPQIGKELSSGKRYSKVDYSFKNQKYYGFGPGLKEEIILYVQNALELYPKRPLTYVLSNGPFFKSSLTFRKEILNHFDIWVKQVKMKRLGDMTFLVGSTPRDKNIFGQKGVSESFIGLGTGKGQNIHFNWPNSTSFKKEFLTSFFSYAKWYVEFNNIFEFPREISAFSPFTILDYYVNDETNLSQKELLQSYVIKSFSTLTKEALLLEDHLYQDVLVEAMDRLIYVARLKNNIENNYFPASFLNELKGLKYSLEVNNLAAN
ncbi:MAG: hypothetical protein DRQ88_12190 [Epsilonproteobacteria bacterium]|nr:MAG: hypothetical protein DRQ88_12190 [Campylobacterota bacterium]